MLEKTFPVGRPSWDGNNDNRANSAQVQMILPTRAELGNIEMLSQWWRKKTHKPAAFSLNIPLVSTINCALNHIN
jgi:hypothetical protein